jgi:cbb3-type cytochrome oxidase maturation protein
MSVLIFLIPITLALGLLGLGFFLWTLKSKQYEDLQGAASRILFDDLGEKSAAKNKPTKKSKEKK